MTYFISPTTIDYLKTFLNYTDKQGQNVEICMYLQPVADQNNNYLSADLEHFWPGSYQEYLPGKFRGTCSWLIKKEYPKFIFHTHPGWSHSFPSIEDIAKILKHQEIVASIIATRWGLWIIQLGEGSRGFLKLTTDQQLDILQKVKKESLDIIYNIEIKLPFNSLLPDDIYAKINKIIEHLSNRLRLKIRLYRWDDIKSNINV